MSNLEILNEVTGKLTSMYNNKVTPGRLAAIVVQGMLVMRKYKALSGEEKKDTLIKALKLLVQAQISDSEEAESFNVLVDSLAPEMIDTIFWAASQKFEFNPKSWFSCCTPSTK